MGMCTAAGCVGAGLVLAPPWVGPRLGQGVRAGWAAGSGPRSLASLPPCPSHPAVPRPPCTRQVTEFMGAGARQFGFMLRGLRLLQPKLEAGGIPLFLLQGRLGWAGWVACTWAAAREPGGRRGAWRCSRTPRASLRHPPRPCPIWAHALIPPSHTGTRPRHAGDPLEMVPQLVASTGASLLVTDFAPLRLGRQWREGVAGKLPEGVPFHEVDAHNVVPCWVASGAALPTAVPGVGRAEQRGAGRCLLGALPCSARRGWRHSPTRSSRLPHAPTRAHTHMLLLRR